MLGIIGDLHMRPYLAYSDYISDKREGEEKEVLDTIVNSFKKCDKIVFLGDQLNGKSNPPEVIRKLVEFIERFDGKEIFIMSGNHDKISAGKTTMDFLKEVKGRNWHIITDDLVTIGDYDFLPYLINPELGAKDKVEASKALAKKLKKLKKNKILFCHHTISECTTTSGCQTSVFDEAMLLRNHVEKYYDMVVGGHIHKPQQVGKVLITGSVFNNEVGEHDKAVWLINEETLDITRIPLPGVGIFKLENPTLKALSNISKMNIVKAVLTDKKINKEELLEELKNFASYLLLEQYPNERKAVISGDNILEFDVDKLLELYAKQKGVDVNQLKLAWKEIK